MNLLVLTLNLLVGFPISTADLDQHVPSVVAAHDRYYVFWADLRDYGLPDYLAGIYGARVTLDGTVIDYNGRPLYRDSTRDESPRVASDGTNMLVVARDGC